jgi:hypothetical protein
VPSRVGQARVSERRPTGRDFRPDWSAAAEVVTIEFPIDQVDLRGAAPGANAKVGLVPIGSLVVEVTCLQQRLRSPGCRAMKSIAFALLVGCTVFFPPYAVHAQSLNRLYPDLQPPTLVPSIPALGPAPQPRVSPGSERQPTQPPRQERATEGMPPGSQGPEADRASSPPAGVSSEQAPPAAPVPTRPGTGFPWWPAICAVLVVMLVFRTKRRA